VIWSELQVDGEGGKERRIRSLVMMVAWISRVGAKRGRGEERGKVGVVDEHREVKELKGWRL